MKAEELTQDDFSNENRLDELEKEIDGAIERNTLSPTRYLTQIDHRTSGILEDLKNAHDEFLKAKYNLYKKRGEFYSDKENWDKCKEKTGKQSDNIFKEYFQSFEEHRKLMKERQESEFKYNQCLRVFESLLK